MGSNKSNSEAIRDKDERRMAWRGGLRYSLDHIVQEPLPDRLRDLLKRIEAAEPHKR